MLPVQQVKYDYWALKLGYDAAIDKLQALGMYEDQADDYLHAKDDIYYAGRKAGGFN